MSLLSKHLCTVIEKHGYRGLHVACHQFAVMWMY